MEEKYCNYCLVNHPLARFYKRSKSKDGRAPRCIAWYKSEEYKSQHATYYQTRPAHVLRADAKRKTEEGKSLSRQRQLKHLYGLSPKQLEQMHVAQEFACAICKKLVEGRMDVDHDHTCCPGKKSCGKCLRKLLCRSCNVVLGKVQEDISVLESMIDYLKFHRQLLVRS